MTELEKVISGIEHHIKGYCNGCPYCKGWHACEAGSENGLFTNALALLKEQKETIPIDFLMRYTQLPTEFAISAWKKPIRDALKNEAKDADKPMSFDDALQLVNDILPINRGEER